MFVTVVQCLSVFAAVAAANRVFQHGVDTETVLPHLSQARAIKEAFSFSWNGYTQYAYGQDELLPGSHKGNNTKSGWGDSVIDALSTAIVMELEDVVLQQLVFVNAIDFTTTKTGNVISLVDVTTRYLGGMLSAYDLLKGPYSDLVPAAKKSLVDGLLTQSTKLADLLSVAFNTTTGVPSDSLKPSGNSTLISINDTQTTTTNIGWLLLEWTHLSTLTGDDTYASFVQNAELYLLDPTNGSVSVRLPGLIGSFVDINTSNILDYDGNWGTNPYVGVGGRGYYEYLIKSYAYAPINHVLHKDRFVTAAETAIMFLFSTTLRIRWPEDLTFVGGFEETFTDSVESHGTLTTAALFYLAAAALRRGDLRRYAGKLLQQGLVVYNATPTKLGYEQICWADLDFFFLPDQLASYEANGFFALDTSYDLKSELVESLYYGYKVTAKEIYRDWAWEVFLAIDRTCRVDSGYSGVLNNMAIGGGGWSDRQGSWWFSQTLKYLWLIFSDDGEGVGVSAGVRQRWVFNNDGHPLRTVR